MCNSKWAAKGFERKDAGRSPQYPILSSSSFMDFGAPSLASTSRKFHAVWSSTASAQTPDATAILGNRAPSSLLVSVRGYGSLVRLLTLSSSPRQWAPQTDTLRAQGFGEPRDPI